MLLDGMAKTNLEETASDKVLFVREGDSLVDFRKGLNGGYLDKKVLDSYEGKQLPCPPYDW